MPVRGKQLAVRSSGAGFQIWSLTLLLHILIYTKLLNFSQPQSPHPQGRTNSNIFVRKVRWRLNGNLHYSHDLVPAAAKLLRSCPTLCDPIDGSPPGCPVPGILQARTLEWVAISFSSAWKWKVIVKSLSHVWLLATPWTAAYQAPPTMGFSRQEYWSGVPLPSPDQVPRTQ